MMQFKTFSFIFVHFVKKILLERKNTEGSYFSSLVLSLSVIKKIATIYMVSIYVD